MPTISYDIALDEYYLVDGATSTEMRFLGEIRCENNPLYNSGKVNDLYAVKIGGKIGGASGKTVTQGDALYCVRENYGGPESENGDAWVVIDEAFVLSASGADSSGSILLRNPDGTSASYTPAENTNESRETSLRAAIAAAVDDSTIYLYNCRASVTTTSLIDSVSVGVTDVTLVFDSDSAVVYGTSSLSDSDRTLFAPIPQGANYRNVRNFGATGDGTTDDYNAIMAAYFSLPKHSSATDEYSRPLRGGGLYFPGLNSGSIDLSSAIYLVGTEVRVTCSLMMDNGAVIKAKDTLTSSDYVLNCCQGASANTSHDRHIDGLSVDGNGVAKGFRLIAAQSSRADNVTVNNCAPNAVYLKAYTASFSNWWITDVDGTGLIVDSSSSLSLINFSIHLAQTTGDNDSDGDRKPAFLIQDSQDIQIPGLQAEDVFGGVKLINCRRVTGYLEVTKGTNAANTYALVIRAGSDNSYDNRFPTIYASKLTHLVRDYTLNGIDSTTYTELANTSGAYTGHYYQATPRLSHRRGYTGLQIDDEPGATIGNDRGAGAIDLQGNRNGATQVASGIASFIAGGEYNTVSGRDSFVTGRLNNVNKDYAEAFGIRGLTHAVGMLVVAGGQLYDGDDIRTQTGIVHLVGRTTNATPTELSINTFAASYLAIPSGSIWAIRAVILGVQDSAANAARYERQLIIQNNGGTTALVGSVGTVGTDIESDAAWDVAITADNTNDRVAVTVTGAAVDIRWVAMLEVTEIQIG